MADQRTHDALVTVAARAPYEVRKFPTVTPQGDEIMVNVKWTASTPLDLHRQLLFVPRQTWPCRSTRETHVICYLEADGGLLVEHPMRTGSTGAGIVVEVGPDVKSFKVGDRVFGFAHQKDEWKTHQEFSTAPEWVFGKVPDAFSLEQAVTLPENLVTAFHTISKDLELPTPWPKPADCVITSFAPPRADDYVLIWGAASSVGQLTIQVLKYYGYKHIVTTASAKHHEYLKELGASEVFDYRRSNVVEHVLRSARSSTTPVYPLIVDCIGSQTGTLEPLSKIAQSGSVVAVMLPVILTHSSDDVIPEYTLDAAAGASWEAGVQVRGVRTHFYWKNDLFRDKLQTEIMPTLLAQGLISPNRYRIIEGKTLVERATNALDDMREGASGEKLIWRVSDE
ncbi:GroES-like protein [Xylariaceae sp. FL1272]|nr:GroES-like protein [Xylariaceae sp. FL1272]